MRRQQCAGGAVSYVLGDARLSGLPDAAHLIIASRTLPPLRIAALAARSQVAGLNEENLRDASRVLARATIRKCDFAEVTKGVGPRDFVYFDPPYAPLTKTAMFTDYVPGGFGPPDQERLVGELRRLRDRGVLAEGKR